MRPQPSETPPKNVTVPIGVVDVEALNRRPLDVRPSTHIVALLRALPPDFAVAEDTNGVFMGRKEAVDKICIHLPGFLVDKVQAMSNGLGFAPFIRAVLRTVEVDPAPDVIEAAPQITQITTSISPRIGTSLRPNLDPAPASEPTPSQRPSQPSQPSQQPSQPPVLPDNTDKSIFLTAPQPNLRWIEHPIRELDLADADELSPIFVSPTAAFRFPWLGPQETRLVIVGMDASEEPSCADRHELDQLLGQVMLQIYERARGLRHRLLCQWRRATTPHYRTTWHLAVIEIKRIA